MCNMYEFIIGTIHRHLVGMPTSGQRQIADQIPINYFSVINCQRWYNVGLMLARCRPIGKPSYGDVGPMSAGQPSANTSGGVAKRPFADVASRCRPDVGHIGHRTLARRWPNVGLLTGFCEYFTRYSVAILGTKYRQSLSFDGMLHNVVCHYSETCLKRPPIWPPCP